MEVDLIKFSSHQNPSHRGIEISPLALLTPTESDNTRSRSVSTNFSSMRRSSSQLSNPKALYAIDSDASSDEEASIEEPEAESFMEIPARKPTPPKKIEPETDHLALLLLNKASMDTTPDISLPNQANAKKIGITASHQQKSQPEKRKRRPSTPFFEEAQFTDHSDDEITAKRKPETLK